MWLTKIKVVSDTYVPFVHEFSHNLIEEPPKSISIKSGLNDMLSAEANTCGDVLSWHALEFNRIYIENQIISGQNFTIARRIEDLGEISGNFISKAIIQP